jgi:hypothetical protein
MPNITGPAVVGGINVYASETVPSQKLGTRVAGGEGSEFVYGLAGELQVVGEVCQGPVIGTDHNALVVVSGTAGSRDVVVTLAAAAVTKNQYQGGIMSINVTPGLNQSYIIESHPAQTSTTGNVTLTLMEPLRTTLSTSSRVALKKNPMNGVISAPVTTLTGAIVGVCVYPIPSGEYGWWQTKGLATVLSDNSSIILGSAIEASLSAASSAALGGTAGTPRIGIALQAKDSGKGIACFLNI